MHASIQYLVLYLSGFSSCRFVNSSSDVIPQISDLLSCAQSVDITQRGVLIFTGELLGLNRLGKVSCDEYISHCGLIRGGAVFRVNATVIWPLKTRRFFAHDSFMLVADKLNLVCGGISVCSVSIPRFSDHIPKLSPSEIIKRHFPLASLWNMDDERMPMQSGMTIDAKIDIINDLLDEPIRRICRRSKKRGFNGKRG